MKPIFCTIVDDEPLARDLIGTYVSQIKGWKTVMACKNTAEAYEALYQHPVDVIFLDIKMPGASGLDFLHSLKNPPAIIFTTAYPEYAVNAFDLKAVDYLVKPITKDRFLQAVEKYHDSKTSLAHPEKESADHVFLKQDAKLIKILFADILYVEALKDFSKVFLTDKQLLIGTHLKMMEDILPSHKFIRVHRSFIVAIDAISAIQGNTAEIGNKTIPIGGLYKEALFRKINLPM